QTVLVRVVLHLVAVGEGPAEGVRAGAQRLVVAAVHTVLRDVVVLVRDLVGAVRAHGDEAVGGPVAVREVLGQRVAHGDVVDQDAGLVGTAVARVAEAHLRGLARVGAEVGGQVDPGAARVTRDTAARVGAVGVLVGRE